MGKAAPLINNFSAGEWGPLASAQVDHPRYPQSLELCQGYVPTLQGGLTRKPGNKYIAATKNNGAGRLEKFVLSRSQAYTLEFGNLFIRFYTDGAQISSAGSPVEVISPYTTAQLFELTFCHQNDTIYIFHPSVPTRKLIRYSDTSWGLTTAIFLYGPYIKYKYAIYPTYSVYKNKHSINTTVASGATTLSFYNGSTVTSIAAVAAYSTGEIQITTTGSHGLLSNEQAFVAAVTGTTEANGTWKVKVLAPTIVVLSGSVFANAWTGAGTINFAPFASTDVGRKIRVLDYPSTPDIWVYATITAFTNAHTVTALITEGAFTAAMPATYILDWELERFCDTLGYPAAGCFHEDRLFLFGPGQYLNGSMTGDYENFRRAEDDGSVTASHAVSFALNSNASNNGLWIVSDEKGLLAGTDGSEWLIKSASTSEGISPTSINAKEVTGWGSKNIQPVKAGKAVIFPQTAGRLCREFNYFYDVDGFRSEDMTELAHHILESGAVQMAFQKQPFGIVWIVRSDGILVGMTYARDVKGLKAAWHRHQIGGVSDAAGTHAKVLSVTTIPSQAEDYDEVWMIVERRINGATKRYVEVMTKFFDEEDDQKDAFFVDAGKTYDDPKTITGITAATPPVVTSAAHGFANGDEILFSDILGMTELNDKRYFVANQAANTWEVIDENGDNVVGADFTAYVSGGYARKMVSSVSGYDHLEGQTVDILGDGAVITSAVVTAGVITLAEKCATVHAGLGYQSKGKLPRLEAGSNDGTALGKTRRTQKVGVMLDRSRGLKIGTDFTTMNEIDFSDENDKSGHAPPLFTGIKIEEFDADYDTQNQLCFMQDKPLPSTILAFLPRLQTQDG